VWARMGAASWPWAAGVLGGRRHSRGPVGAMDVGRGTWMEEVVEMVTAVEVVEAAKRARAREVEGSGCRRGERGRRDEDEGTSGRWARAEDQGTAEWA
jgi:hypothetical protein